MRESLDKTPVGTQAESAGGKNSPTPVVKQHSKLPWEALHDMDGDYGIFSGDTVLLVTYDDTDEDEANAEFVVRAVNHHEELVKALRNVLTLYTYHASPFSVVANAAINRADEVLRSVEAK